MIVAAFSENCSVLVARYSQLKKLTQKIVMVEKNPQHPLVELKLKL